MRKKSGVLSAILFWMTAILLMLSLVILAYSIYIQQVPDKASEHLWSKVKGEEIELQPSVKSLISELEIKNALIDSLSLELKKYKKENIYKKAIVDVEEGTLNMRDKPMLSSNIVARIPDSSFVDVMYFDTKTYFLGGKSGRWCRIKYADQEGWVWDGFIHIQN